MAEKLLIVGADRVNGDEVIVEFSDGTFVVYGIDLLLELAPRARKIASSKDKE